MIRTPMLSQSEKAMINENLTLPTDIFLQGAILYLLGRKEDGLDKALAAARKVYQDEDIDKKTLEKKTRRILQCLALGKNDAWEHCLQKTSRRKDSEIRGIFLKFNPN